MRPYCSGNFFLAQHAAQNFPSKTRVEISEWTIRKASTQARKCPSPGFPNAGTKFDFLQLIGFSYCEQPFLDPFQPGCLLTAI